jgi:predicted nucleic acid-binding protein
LELIAGARDSKELVDIDTFLSAYVIVPLRDAAGRKAYELLNLYAKPHGLHVFDSLLAASAIEEGLTLVTKNRRHFSVIKELKLEVPGYS